MPIATPEVYAEMLGRAKENSVAFPAINCVGSESINAAIKGFADAGSDGIIQFSTGGAEFGSGLGVKDMVTGAVALAERVHLQREIGERKYRAIFENADSGLFVVDRRMALESCNHAFYRQLDLLRLVESHQEISLTQLNWRKPDALKALLERCAVLNQSVSDDFEYLVDEQGTRWFNVTLTPVGEQLIQGQLTDISRHKQAELSAQQEAITDSLTGLLNRRAALDLLAKELVRQHHKASQRKLFPIIFPVE